MNYFESVRDVLPELYPSKMLKFFNLEPLNKLQKSQKLEVGKKYELESFSLFDFLSTLPREHTYNPKYVSKYHNSALQIATKLVGEGLLSPVGNSEGIYQKYKGNGYDATKAEYGYYEFLIFGFPEIRYHFEEAIRPIIVKDKKYFDESIGTGFAVLYGNNKQYFITAKHCLPENNKIYFKPFLPNEHVQPQQIYIPKNKNVDIAILEFSMSELLSNKFFLIDKPFPLDRVIITGYPPIAGTSDAVQISTTGEITAISQTYWHSDNQIYVNAKVKGGSSGSPVIAYNGYVVGIMIETLKDIKDPEKPDELGLGVALSSELIDNLLKSINGIGDTTIHKNLEFTKEDDNSFSIKKEN